MGTVFSYGNKLLQKEVARLKSIKKVAVIGSGTMGIGIGIDILNKTGYDLIFIDVSDKSLKRAKKNIGSYFSGLVDNGRMLEEQAEQCLKKVTYRKDFSLLARAEVIWEVATEKIEIKKVIFENIEKYSDPKKLVFIFSNTSSHTTGELAVLFKDMYLRDKFLTGHGYFPFHANRLFDVMKGKYASEETFIAGVAFAEQILEKKVIALRNDHHGYIADPIFEGMSAIISWDIRTGQDLVELPQVFELLTSNPFQVLDRTGHMPYTESAKHMKMALPVHDRLRSIYDQEGRPYPEWIEELETSGRTGINTPEKEGIFKWSGQENNEKPVAAYDPATRSYVAIKEINYSEYWSLAEAKALDHRQSVIKGIDGLIRIAESGDKGGKTLRRYLIPFMLYTLDLIQDHYATAADIDSSTKTGLRFKYGLCEIIDRFLDHFGIDGFLALAKKSGAENPDRSDLYDVDGKAGPRKGNPSLLYTMKKNGWSHLLGYGRIYRTPVSHRNFLTGEMEHYFNDLRYVFPGKKERVASIIFDNPLRGNVWNKNTLDQLDHAIGISVKLYQKGHLGALFFTASGKGMRMLGADARQFNKGWFDAKKGYQFLGEEGASTMTRAGMKLFRFIQEMPFWTIGVFGEKWGGGAEFTYFLNQRFDLVINGVEFDSIKRKNVIRQKKNYNQPEIEYGILGGFGAVQELIRLGFGESLIDELFLQGMTATRAYGLGLSNGIEEDEFTLLEKAFEVARLKQKYAVPYAVALYNLQKKNALNEGSNDERLAKETGETFNPEKNPYISTSLLRLLNIGGNNPPIDMMPKGKLPGWENNYKSLYDNNPL